MESKREPRDRGLPPGGRTAACAAALAAINAVVVWRLFGIAYTTQMGSIEAAFIGLARYIRDHFPDLRWFPLWYGGIPYPDTYPPLLHFAVAAVGACFHISTGLAYHAVTAAAYCLTPAALFWALWRLGAGRAPAFVCALLYSLLSPACWLVREVRADTGGWFGPRRLVTMVRYGEGPHLASLLFLPLAIGLLHIALQKRRPPHYVAAAIAMAAVVLSNWIGGFAMALAAAAYLISFGGWLRAAAIAVYAYALALPWVTPSTIATIRANAPLVGGRFMPSARLEILFAAGLLALAFALARARVTPAARFALLFLYGTGFLALAGYWFGASLLPQPTRYHLEMDMAFWMAVALGIPWRKLTRFFTVNRQIAVLLGCVACAALLLHQRSMARAMVQPIDIRSTAEYGISSWLGAHMPGRRVFAPGTIGFWMNAFSDTPMLVGGFDNGMRNTYLQDVIFQVYAGDKQQVALDWLDAFGCDAVVGGGPQSREVYHPYAHPDKFAGLRELWRDRGDVIYAVPRAGTSLAHVVRRDEVPAVRPPTYDSSPLAPYLHALRDPTRPHATFRWTSAHSASITADLQPDQLLSVQVTWDQGWSARVHGQPRPIRADALGQMAIAPHCSGPCTVELRYDGGAEMRAAVWTCVLAWAGGALWILLWRRRSGLTKTS